MTSSIAFRKDLKQVRQYDPRKNFELTTVGSEIRYDPLTGDSGRICHFVFKTAPPSDISELVARSAANCPFCPDRVLQVTPRFTEDLIPEGRLRRGPAVLFPNLFPYDDISAVAVISEGHFHSMDDIPVQVVEDGLGIARDFFRRIESRPAAAPSYGIVTWNYMPPSGGTQVHPHMQVYHTTSPGNALTRELTAERAYRERVGRTYLADLLAAERAEGVRWVGDSSGILWYTPFVPTGTLGDCVAAFPERATLAELTDREIQAFAQDLRRILKAFSAIGLWSFNLMFFPDRAGSSPDVHWLTARLVPRLYLNPVLHVTDVAYLQLLMKESLGMVYPEETAARLRQAF